MMPTRTLAPLLLGCALLGCARESAQDAACDAQVNRDPVVQDLILKGAGSEHFRLESYDRLRLAKQRARLACLQGRGVVPRGGGVEPPNPL